MHEDMLAREAKAKADEEALLKCSLSDLSLGDEGAVKLWYVGEKEIKIKVATNDLDDI